MILEVKHLRTVMAVAAHGSITRASRELHLSQPALSQQLLLLERRLGVPLFHRVGKRMVPSAAGVRVLATARALVGELDALEEGLRRLASGQEALVRLGTQCYSAFHWLPAVLGAYAERHPTVDVQIVSAATHAPERALLDGRIDVGLLYDRGTDARLEYVPLFEDELVVVVPPGHPFARRAFVEPADLGGEHLITYAVPPGKGIVTQRVLRPAGVRPRRVTEVQWTEAITEFVRAGLGVSILARWAVAPQLRSRRLRAVRLTEGGFRRRWHAALLASAAERSAPHVRALITLLARGPRAARRRE